MSLKGLLGLFGAVAVVGSASSASAATIYAINDSGTRLLSFDSATPRVIQSSKFINGLSGGDSIIAIDFRPSTSQLYGLTDAGQLVTLNLANAVSSSVANVTPPLNGNNFGFDFNPMADRIRITSDANQNLNVSPTTGADNGASAPLFYVAPPGLDPNIVGSAYLNSVPSAGSTSLYGIDSGADTLVTQNPANAGGLTTVGGLGVDTTGIVGFDILTNGSSNTGFVALNPSLTNLSNLYTVNLTTGLATYVDQIGGGMVVRDISVVLIPEPTGLAALFAIGFVAVRRRRA